MNWLISEAWAQGAPPPGGGLFNLLLPIGFLVLFYFLLIRPQMRRQKEHRAMVASLEKGDEVVTNGGLLGRITAIDDSFLTVQIAQQIEVRVQRHAISAVMPKGTMKSAE